MNKLNKITNLIPTYYRALRNKNTPKAAKFAVIAAVLYAVMPADIVADVIPVVGVLDDAVVMSILLYIASRMIPENVIENEKDKILEDTDYEVIE